MRKFGTFEGVFTPTILSILGVIMYLRLGWVVGEAGLKGALSIIFIANIITLFTGLSIASITTNIRIGVGGAYSIISKSLGLEVGGAIGIPLYLSQAFSVAFYITGFTECWVAVFPQHNFILVSIILWMLLGIVSYSSARLAFRLQYVVMAIIALSLISAFLAKGRLEQSGLLWQASGDVGFWKVFAIFFPAVTGILAGVSMSGELKEPQRSIPLGTISAILVSFIIYVTMAIWFSRVASAQDLINNTSIIIDLARWRFLVIAGIMGATLSSALSMFVASPRTLLALGKHKVIPLSTSFGHINKKGEPTTAILFTALLALLTILIGTLNKTAGVLTMFFLITYGMINISVFIEKGIGIISFRPSFKIPLIFSFLGAVGCFYAMFLINPIFSLIALFVTVGIYVLLLRREMRRDWPDVRKGLFIFIAEQAMKIAHNLPYHPKIWKPNLLIPVKEPRDWLGLVEFIRAITYPNGKVELFSIVESPGKPSGKKSGVLKEFTASDNKDKEALSLLGDSIKEEGLLVSSAVIESDDFLSGADIVMQTLKDSFLPPNILFIRLGLSETKDNTIKSLIDRAVSYGLGLIVFKLHPKAGFGQRQLINLWIRRGSPNINLAVLIALQLKKNWEARLRLVLVVSDKNECAEATVYLYKLKKIMRLPKETEVQVLAGRFEEMMLQAPLADINIFGMPQVYDVAWFRQTTDKIQTSTIFLRDSKQESAIV